MLCYYQYLLEHPTMTPCFKYTAIACKHNRQWCAEMLATSLNKPIHMSFFVSFIYKVKQVQDGISLLYIKTHPLRTKGR